MANKEALKVFTAEIIDRSGIVQNVPADAVKLENGTTWIKARTFTELAGGTVTYDGTKHKSTFDFSNKLPPVLQYPHYEHLTKWDIITAKPEQLKIVLIKDKLSGDGINGGYFDGSLNPLGIVIIEGKVISDRISYRPPRTTFVIDKNGKADILANVEKASKIDVNYALGAGPNLLPTVSSNEGFQNDIMNSVRGRSSIGITTSGLVKLVATDAMTLQQLSNLMGELGCVKAMNLDGGGSSQMRFGEKMIRSGDGRKLSTAIYTRTF